MTLEIRAVEPFYKNGFVLGCEQTRQGIIIDPGDEADLLLDVVRRERLEIKYVLLTHAHLDHITGVGRVKAEVDAPVGLHRDDHFLYEQVEQQGQAFGFRVERQPPVDFFYDGEGPYHFGQYTVSVHHTPGHCPGGVCLAVARDREPPRLFVGDTLFAGSIGRTDLPGGNLEILLRSIREVLFSFPDAIEVYPGHGPSTTIGHEKRTNPFLTGVL